MPEFTGYNQNYREFRTTLISQLSTISSAYRLQLSTPPEYVDFETLRPFLPMWIYTENLPDPNEDHTEEVLNFYNTATNLVAEMTRKINDDMRSRLY